MDRRSFARSLLAAIPASAMTAVGANATSAAATLPKYSAHGIEMTENEFAAYRLGRHSALREVAARVDLLKAEQDAEAGK